MGATDRRQKIILAAVAAVLIGLIAVLVVTLTRPSEGGFIPPAPDPNARSGMPSDIDEMDRYGSLTLPIANEQCTIALNTAPSVNGKDLAIDLTSLSDNTVWLRIVLTNETGETVAESGILRPGEYTPTLTLKQEVTSGDVLQVKFITYQPDTYYSMGNATAAVQVR